MGREALALTDGDPSPDIPDTLYLLLLEDVETVGRPRVLLSA